MGTDGLDSCFPPGRSCDPSPRLHVRRREWEDNKSGRGCSAPYLPKQKTRERNKNDRCWCCFRSLSPPVPELKKEARTRYRTGFPRRKNNRRGAKEAPRHDRWRSVVAVVPYGPLVYGIDGLTPFLTAGRLLFRWDEPRQQHEWARRSRSRKKYCEVRPFDTRNTSGKQSVPGRTKELVDNSSAREKKKRAARSALRLNTKGKRKEPDNFAFIPPSVSLLYPILERSGCRKQTKQQWVCTLWNLLDNPPQKSLFSYPIL